MVGVGLCMVVRKEGCSWSGTWLLVLLVDGRKERLIVDWIGRWGGMVCREGLGERSLEFDWGLISGRCDR